VTAVELHATPVAESLYRSMGFSDEGPTALRVRDLGRWFQTHRRREGEVKVTAGQGPLISELIG
jgi:hypothetical protein